MKKILVVAGRSGSGKTSALHVFEDLGFYTIDNLPLSLMAEIVAKLEQDNSIELLALGIDVRSLGNEQQLIDEVLERLRQYAPLEVVYLTARDEVLLSRYASSRRPHPLAGRYDNSLSASIEAEQHLLYPIYQRATLTVDTSDKSIHDLKHTLSVKLGQGDQLIIILQSFGFKHGLPLDADYVFDLRHLPNPHWMPELRPFSGLDEPVQQFLGNEPLVNAMYEDIFAFFDKWLPIFAESHRHFLTISLGCTGGKHRSVYFVDRLAADLKAKWAVQILHREMKHWS